MGRSCEFDETSNMVMITNHRVDVSDDELAIIRKFGDRYRRTRQTIMTIGELLTDLPGARGGGERGGRMRAHHLHEVIDRLINRGWLVVSTTLHWNERTDCMLLGEASNIARRLAGEGSEGDAARARAAARSCTLSINMNN